MRVTEWAYPPQARPIYNSQDSLDNSCNLCLIQLQAVLFTIGSMLEEQSRPVIAIKS